MYIHCTLINVDTLINIHSERRKCLVYLKIEFALQTLSFDAHIYIYIYSNQHTQQMATEVICSQKEIINLVTED